MPCKAVGLERVQDTALGSSASCMCGGRCSEDDLSTLDVQLCSIFHVPIAIVSLVDTDRQWFKSIQGLPGVSETPRTTSFCAWTLLPKNPEVLIVQDAMEDERYCRVPPNLPHPARSWLVWHC